MVPARLSGFRGGLWFVVAALNPATVTRTLFEIERDCANPVLEFKKLHEYFVDLDLPV